MPQEALEIALETGLSVRGRVVGYAGRDGFDLWVGVRWRGPERWTQVGEDGSFDLRGLPPGTYELLWQRAGRKAGFGRSGEAGGPALELRLPGR